MPPEENNDRDEGRLRGEGQSDLPPMSDWPETPYPHKQRPAPLGKIGIEDKKRWDQKLFTILIVLLLLLAMIFIVITAVGNPIVHKATLQSQIRTAIENEADLRTIRHIYNRRKRTFDTKIFHSKKDDYYSMDAPLSSVLEDIRTDIFLSEKQDPSFLSQLDALAVGHLQTNPFDKLELTQKDFFENIRVKAADAYPVIQGEINKIVDELYNKNTLVSQYLRDSRTSFWISIIALVFSVMVGFGNIVGTRKLHIRVSTMYHALNGVLITMTKLKMDRATTPENTKK